MLEIKDDSEKFISCLPPLWWTMKPEKVKQWIKDNFPKVDKEHT